jgi:manganese/zinc/iron transport system permease protein
VLAFMLTGAKDPLMLVLGAAVAGWIGTLGVMWIVRQSRLPEDTALGIVLSVFFGVGLVLLTYVQREPTASQAGLNTFLFGQAATLVVADVIVIAGLGSIALVVVALFWKEFKLLSFDREFGSSLGMGMRGIDVLLTTVLVIAIVIGLQTVGVVLMSAMVVAPAAAARQWTDSLGVMVILSAIFGALSGVTGAVASSTATGIPTGPAIVLAVTVVVALSLTLAPRRGLVWEWVRHKRNQQKVRTGAILTDLYALASQHEQRGHGHQVAVLEAMDARRGGVRRTLEVLEAEGLATRAADDSWSLTLAGEQEARAEIARRGNEDA